MTKIANPVIRQIYDTGKVQDQNGDVIDVWAQVTEAHCAALYETVLKRCPKLCVEIGMACGFGFYALALVVTVAGLFVLTVLGLFTGRGVSRRENHEPRDPE